MGENLTVEELEVKKVILSYYITVNNIILYTCFFIELSWFIMFLYRIIKNKDSNFITPYYIVLLIGYLPNILAVAMFIPIETLKITVKVPEFVQVVYGIIRWYNYRLYGPWNTILALNRFTGIFFYKNHKTIWSNMPFKIILLILFIYPFILGSHVLMNFKCLWPSYADDNILICSNFYDSFVSYSNLFNAGISLFLGILTAFARKIKGQKWAKKQKFETYLLVQSIISTLFLCISETSTLIYSMVQHANSLKPFTNLQDFIVKAILISTTNWMGVFFHCSPTILIICLSKQIRESFISFYRLYFIPGIQNPKKTQILPINSLTQSR